MPPLADRNAREAYAARLCHCLSTSRKHVIHVQSGESWSAAFYDCEYPGRATPLFEALVLLRRCALSSFPFPLRFRAVPVLESCTLLALWGWGIERLIKPVLRGNGARSRWAKAQGTHQLRAMPGGPRVGRRRSFNRAIARGPHAGSPPSCRDVEPWFPQCTWSREG